MADFNVRNTPPNDIASKIQRFDNVKNLSFSLLRMERFDRGNAIKLKFDVTTYNEAEVYAREIERMLLSASGFDPVKPKLPKVTLQAVIPSIGANRTFDLSIQSDLDIYLEVIKDGSICRRILSTAMLMQYLTELIDVKIIEQATGDTLDHEFNLDAASVPVTGSINDHKLKTEIRPET